MKKWNVLDTCDSSDLILQKLLNNRGLTTKEQIDTFLNSPSIFSYIKKLPTDFKKALKDSKELIQECISNNIPIVIHGDYDSDGICATSILFNTLKYELNYSHIYTFIPNRFKHGYGLSNKSIQDILDMLKNTYSTVPKDILFITVDSGITSFDEVAYIKSLGYKIILTDHHQKPDNVPKPDVLLWDDTVVGSTISWILSKAIGSKDTYSIALSGIATVTDVFPLIGFNRVIVKETLNILNTNPPYGLSFLFSELGIQDKTLTTYDLGWIIGPRLNATGRMTDAIDAIKLLTERNKSTIQKHVHKVNEANDKRQQKTMEMYDLVSFKENEKIPKIILSANSNFHEGIIGLVASRLVQKYSRPAIVISVDGEESKGSVRSISSINIIEILRKYENLFINVGGHPMAAGFTIKTSKIDILKQNLEEYFDKNISKDLLVLTIDIDINLPIKLISLDLLNDINKLKPFGMGNFEPTFLSQNVSIVGTNIVGKENNHLTLRLYEPTTDIFLKAILFNFVDVIDFTPKVGDNVDIVYKIRENEYNNKTYIDLHIVDMCISKQ